MFFVPRILRVLDMCLFANLLWEAGSQIGLRSGAKIK